MKKKIIRIGTVIMVIGGIGIGGFLIWFNTQINKPDYTTGFVDYTYEKNAVATLDNSNGAKDFMQAILDFDTTTYPWFTKDLSKPRHLTGNIIHENKAQEVPEEAEVIKRDTKSLNLIRTGAKKEYAELPKIDPTNYSCKMPNFLRVQWLPLLLVTEGKRFEKNKEYSKAIENYLAVIRFGQVVGGERLFFIGKLISVAVERRGFYALEQLVKNNPSLSDKDYQDIISQLEQLRKKELSPRNAMEMDFQGLRNYIENWNHHPEQIGTSPPLFIRHSSKLKTYLYLYFLKGRVLNHLDDFTKIYLPFLDKSYSEIHNTNFDNIIKNSDPYLQNELLGCIYSVPRVFITESQNRMSELNVALEYYRMKNKEYPDSLDQLSPEILKEPILDPITGKPFIYHKTKEGFELYSIGPDLKDDKGALIYDPTNGTVSAWDIVY